jgi:microsomal dipeptidase-like Zn-dependent dipeptidase
MARGYTGAQMRKILGENLLRVMEAVQNAAK